ncbi:endoribonuclease L-PSP [Colletotrichum limetticola]|uniref:Endoribonuclease L-PSP n=1 Tax=Colletotrichum limetticola TaxID=1209924 RepID=A0ABQ9PKE1_9PEZI|nr:endoribonuclease L-PSP [Colletotrichum limetticola]
MSGLQYFSYKGYGEKLLQEMHYSQAVRVGDNIEISGQIQGGWDSKTGEIPSNLMQEIDQAFENVDIALKEAGGQGWSQVFRIRLYALDEAWTEDGLGRMVENMKKWTPNHAPILTGIGASKLGQPGMRLEVEVSAYDPKGPR